MDDGLINRFLCITKWNPQKCCVEKENWHHGLFPMVTSQWYRPSFLGGQGVWTLDGLTFTVMVCLLEELVQVCLVQLVSLRLKYEDQDLATVAKKRRRRVNSSLVSSLYAI